MTQSLHQERNVLFYVESSLFTDPKAHGYGANVFSLENALDVLLGAVRNRGGHAAERFVTATRVPFVFSVYITRQFIE